MKYKVGDKFPVKWNKSLFYGDGDFYIYGNAIINGEEVNFEICVSSIFESTIAIPPLPNEGFLVVTGLDGDDVIVAPEEWKSENIFAEDWWFDENKEDE